MVRMREGKYSQSFFKPGDPGRPLRRAGRGISLRWAGAPARMKGGTGIEKPG